MGRGREGGLVTAGALDRRWEDDGCRTREGARLGERMQAANGRSNGGKCAHQLHSDCIPSPVHEFSPASANLCHDLSCSTSSPSFLSFVSR